MDKETVVRRSLLLKGVERQNRIVPQNHYSTNYGSYIRSLTDTMMALGSASAKAKKIVESGGYEQWRTVL